MTFLQLVILNHINAFEAVFSVLAEMRASSSTVWPRAKPMLVYQAADAVRCVSRRVDVL